MYNRELTDQVQNDYAFESAYLQAEKENDYEELKKSLTKHITKLSRKEAKGKYLYRRLSGQLKLV